MTAVNTQCTCAGCQSVACEIHERGPIDKTLQELAGILARQLSMILGNNITSDALDSRPMSLRPDDVIVNVHLFERLGTAYEAIKALRGYSGKPRGYRPV